MRTGEMSLACGEAFSSTNGIRSNSTVGLIELKRTRTTLFKMSAVAKSLAERCLRSAILVAGSVESCEVVRVKEDGVTASNSDSSSNAKAWIGWVSRLTGFWRICEEGRLP